MPISNISLNQHKKSMFGDYLSLDGLTEIAVNRPDELFTKTFGVWERHDVPLSLGRCQTFATALANYQGDHIDDTSPILSATLESGERCQVVMSPACERGTVSITLRKPSLVEIPHSAYIEKGFYQKVMDRVPATRCDDALLAIYHAGDVPRFMEKCVEFGKTIVVVGETGSGKTTYMKMLIGYIPTHLRLITIEDNPEIKFHHHENYVHLFYPADAGDKAIVTPASLVRANYRMNPDRILLAEIRGGEAWDCLKIIGSGHEGLITSEHAGSPLEAITGLVERCYQNTECQNIPYSLLLRKVLDSIDVIASIDIEGDVRTMGDIYFKPVHRAEIMENFCHDAF